MLGIGTKNPYIEPIFEVIFSRKFNVNEDADRREMQIMVYLLQSIGVPVGDYGFVWGKRGPYSHKLSREMSSLIYTSTVATNAPDKFRPERS